MSLSSRAVAVAAAVPFLALVPSVPAHADTLSGTVVALQTAARPVLMLVTHDMRVHSVHLRRGALAGVRRGRVVTVGTVRSRRVHKVLRTAPARASSVTFTARVVRASATRPTIRLARRLTLPISAQARITHGHKRLTAGALAKGAAVRVTWSLSSHGTIRSTRVDLASAPARPTAAGVPSGAAPAGVPADDAPDQTGPLGPVLFEDGFDGATGAPADPAKWVPRGDTCDGFVAQSCPRDANVFQDGNGSLVLRVQRESDGRLGSGPYSGAFLGTFAYGSGWPARNVKASWAVPYHIEMRALMPASAGLWPIAWDVNVDRSQGEGVRELDWSEQRMSYPTTAGCHQHNWIGGVDTQIWDGERAVSDMAHNWHTYSADVWPDRVEYRVDGRKCGLGPSGVTGRFGLLLNNVVSKPGTWSSGGLQPAATDPGPWDMKVDYVRVSAQG